MKYPVDSLRAEEYRNLINSVSVFNKQNLTEYLYVKLPIEYCVNSEVMQVAEHVYNGAYVQYDQDEERPWLQIPWNCLNLEAGSHTYIVYLESKDTRDAMNLYFAYIIQDDNPEKPYIYMNRDSN